MINETIKAQFSYLPSGWECGAGGSKGKEHYCLTSENAIWAIARKKNTTA